MKPAFQSIEQARQEMRVASARSFVELQAGFVKNSRAYSDFADDAALYIARTSNDIECEAYRFCAWGMRNADMARRQNIKVGYRVQLGSKRTGISAHKRSDCLRDFAFFGRCVQDWSIAEAALICGYRAMIGLPVNIEVKP